MKIPRIFRFVIVFFVVVALVGTGAFLIKRKKRELAKAPKYDAGAMMIHAATAHQGTLKVTQDYLAVVEPFRDAQVSARITAVIDKLLCNEGDFVKEGQVLIQLDDREIRDGIAAMDAQIQQVKAELAGNQATVKALEETRNYWKKEAERDTTLAQRGTIPESAAEATRDKATEAQGKLDAARKRTAALRHQVTALQKKKEQLQTQLDYCTIRSPFPGVVKEHLVEEGDLAAPGKPLIIIEDRTKLQLAFDVPQQDLSKVHEGLPVLFAVGDRQEKVSLSHLYPSLNQARMLRAEVYLDENQARGLHPGEYVSVSVVLREQKGVTLIPATALIESNDRKPYVFVVADKHLKSVPVTILGTQGDEVAVSGIAPETVIADSTFLGWAQLSSGREVEVIK